MAGYDMLAVEIATSGSTLYYGTHDYYTRSGDSPASQFFESRLITDLTFDRRVGTTFWGQRPRGSQNFGTIEIANGDGGLDSLVAQSLRDKSIVVKRGNSADAYSAFSTVATLIVDRIEFPDEERVILYVKDISGKLERALQQTVYPSSITNQALRGRPRPITLGRCYQVPVAQPDTFGNGHFDVHADDNWVGIEQLLDQGAGLLEGAAYSRSTKSGIYGFERLNAIGGRQLATVLGAFTVTTTEASDDFANLTAWSETNGGVGGRDASISSNQLRMLNTAGGADLQLTWSSVISALADEYFFYEFDCTSWTSGSAQFRSDSATIERTIDKVGRYTGIIRQGSAIRPRFYALNGSNCDLLIDTFRIKKVAPIELLSAFITYLCVTKGVLASGDLDSTVISALQTAAPYALGFHASEPVQIADVLDQVMRSFGGWWYVNRSGKLTVGRLLSPSGSPTYTFDQSNIAPGMRIEFDQAQGLSNVLLAKRNWAPYGEGDLIASINAVSLNPSDKDADVALSNTNYNYSATNVGSVRSTPVIYGDRYYVEVDPTTVDGTSQHYVGWGASGATITQYPGQDANAIAYRANGQTYTGAAGTAFGSAWTAANRIPMAVDMRAAAMGSRAQHMRYYWAIDSTWQASANPAAGTGFVAGTTNSTGWQYVMVGNNVAGTNAGSVNFGQSTFTLAPPDDYIPIAWHRQYILADYRYKYQSATGLATAYAHALSAPLASSDTKRSVSGGVPTLISGMADARTECDRWCSLFATERFFYTFDAYLDSGVAVDQIEPGDLISVSYTRFGLSSKLLRVIGVKGSMLERRVTITAWG